MTTLFRQLVGWTITLGLVAGLLPIKAIAAETPLTIGNIAINVTNAVVTISWTTNRKATGQLELGVSSTYDTTVPALTTHDTSHAVTIAGLTSDTLYHYRLTARSGTQEVTTFDRTFETDEFDDNVAPTITKVTTPYVTGTTVTIQWQTDEPTTGRLRWGKTDQYGATASSAKGTVHDVTLRGLETSTIYHYRVEATDTDKHVATYTDLTVRTSDTRVADTTVLSVSELTPVSPNDSLLGSTSATITWRTNKLADGAVQTGSSTRLGRTVRVPGARDFVHAVTLSNLKPETTYYFRVVSKDVFGVTVRSEIAAFTTREADGFPSAAPTQPTVTDEEVGTNDGAVLGTSTADCSAISRNTVGLWGQYFNLVPSQNELRRLGRTTIPGTTESEIRSYTGWYQSQFLSLTRVDPSLNFRTKFHPLNEGKERDPHYFAVRWRAAFTLAADARNLNFALRSDDDSWAFIDGNLVINNGGRHAPKTVEATIDLEAGVHELVILYGERQPNGASIVLTTPTEVVLHPLPDGCAFDSLGQGKPATGSTGAVLGTATPGRERYTPADALLREVGTRDIYAILRGRKHLISGPTSFAEYGYTHAQVRVVPPGTLDRYNDVKLVRIPQGPPTIFYLYTRPDVRWRKLGLPSPTAFVSYPQNRWGDVVVINHYDLDSYPSARLVRTTDDPRVYLLTDGGKRLIPSAQAFEAAGYRWADVVEVSVTHLNSYATLEPVNSATVAAATQ